MDREANRHERPGPRAHGQSTWPGLIAVIGVLALVATSAGAGGVPPLALVKSPYSGHAITGKIVTTNGCGGVAKAVRPPTFNLSSGRARFIGSSSVAGCGAAGVMSSSGTSLHAGLGGMGLSFTSGAHKVWVNWTVAWTVNLTATAGNFTQMASAYATVSAFAYVFDATNNSVFYPTNSWSASLSTGSGALNRFLSVNVSLVISGTLVATHSYTVVTAIVGNEGTLLSSGGTGTATGLLNVSSGPNHARLTSIATV
jgi:hypothetical protein